MPLSAGSSCRASVHCWLHEHAGICPATVHQRYPLMGGHVRIRQLNSRATCRRVLPLMLEDAFSRTITVDQYTTVLPLMVVLFLVMKMWLAAEKHEKRLRSQLKALQYAKAQSIREGDPRALRRLRKAEIVLRAREADEREACSVRWLGVEGSEVLICNAPVTEEAARLIREIQFASSLTSLAQQKFMGRVGAGTRSATRKDPVLGCLLLALVMLLLLPIYALIMSTPSWAELSVSS